MKNICLHVQCDAGKAQLEKMLSTHGFTITTLNEVKDEKVTVIVNGPLTELATAIFEKDSLHQSIEQILFVGGTDRYGDVTPLAEKNVYADPDSAQAVFLSGIPIVMFGLNVTRDIENRNLLPFAYLMDPSLFTIEHSGVFVETAGKKSRGATITDLYSDKQFEHQYVDIVKAIDFKRLNGIHK